jgi:hypothetical protein
MESQSQKIISLIQEILSLLKLSDEVDAVYYHDFLVYTLGQLNKPHEIHSIAENILKAYGGMATFSDVSLYKDGEPLIEQHLKFSDLREKLYVECKNAVSSSRG